MHPIGPNAYRLRGWQEDETDRSQTLRRGPSTKRDDAAETYATTTAGSFLRFVRFVRLVRFARFGRMLTLRTALYVPGDRADRIGKALASAADCVIVDLEDAVAATQKRRAREVAVESLAALDGKRSSCPTVAVRVNALSTGLLNDDIAALAEVWSQIGFIVLPMVPNAEAVREVAAILESVDPHAASDAVGPRLVPLIESARGVLHSPAIAAAHARVHTLALGPADLSNELGISPSPDGVELLHVRSQLVLAAAAAGLARPLDGPWLNVADADGLRRSAEAGKVLGFGGKQVIHPAQIDVVSRTYAPTEAQLLWARTVDAAFAEAEARGVSSISLPDGTFVDYPVAFRARAILAE